jgi:hypothetical protein
VDRCPNKDTVTLVRSSMAAQFGSNRERVSKSSRSANSASMDATIPLFVSGSMAARLLPDEEWFSADESDPTQTSHPALARRGPPTGPSHVDPRLESCHSIAPRRTGDATRMSLESIPSCNGGARAPLRECARKANLFRASLASINTIHAIVSSQRCGSRRKDYRCCVRCTCARMILLLLSCSIYSVRLNMARDEEAAKL